MARTGGRAARWAVGTSAAAASALLVTVGIALGGEDAALQPAAVGLSAPSTTSAEAPAAAPSVTAPPSSAVASEPATTSASASTMPSREQTSTSALSTSAAASAAASNPSTAIVDPGLAEPEYYTWPGATADAPLVSFIGDSWTRGNGATDLVGYAYLTGRELGWAHRVLGVGGSGYVLGGSDDLPFDERILPAVAGNPDVVVIQGTINERITSTRELKPAVVDTLARLVRAAGPDTEVVVVGASHVPGLPDADVDRVNDVVRAEAARQGLLFVDVVAEAWSDPTDPSIWKDRYHVNDVGAQQVADRLAPVLRTVLGG